MLLTKLYSMKEKENEQISKEQVVKYLISKITVKGNGIMVLSGKYLTNYENHPDFKDIYIEVMDSMRKNNEDLY
jgi:hypothetical protein